MNGQLIAIDSWPQDGSTQTAVGSQRASVTVRERGHTPVRTLATFWTSCVGHADWARWWSLGGAALAVLAMVVYLAACGYLAHLLARSLAESLPFLPQQLGLVQGAGLALR
jgi:hypothetical protein